MSNQRLLIGLLSLVALMLVLSALSVPIYRLFCQSTGYGGQVKVSKAPGSDGAIGNNEILVTFDSNVDKELDWEFKPQQNKMILKPGKTALAYYECTNNSNFDVTGMAIYNVTPHAIAQYFNKIECFCFEELVIKAKQKIILPVLFFLDYELTSNAETKNIKTITLSYTFFKIN